MLFYRLRFFFLFLILTAFARTEGTTHLSFRGFLSEQEVKNQSEKLADVSSPLLIEISSSSGELTPVIEFARDIYALKKEKNLDVIVYIDEKALGPAAILPFLADRLYASPFVSWGDIPLDGDSSLPTNILRNQVVSLIGTQRPNAKTLQLMAGAMVDPKLKVIDDNGWKLERNGSSETVISPKEETLVVNHHQLESLKIITTFLSPKEFANKFKLEVPKTPLIKQEREAKHPLKILPQDLAERFTEHVKFDSSKPITIGHLIIEDRKVGINEGTWLYVKSALDEYKETQPTLIILELNTPGGQVYASQKISDALKEMDTQYNIPTVAFINNWAISAGAMLAYSCRFIAIVKDAAMGAAEPILQGSEGKSVTASEKVNSALRADFSNRARFFDRNPLLAEAMVDKEMILVLRHGKIVKLQKEDQIRRSGSDPDLVITAEGKLLTLDSKELIDFGVADLLLPPTKLTPITEEEKKEHKWPASKSLLFTQPPFNALADATIDSYEMDWRVSFFTYLAHPFVASLLFMGMLMGFYMEMSSPGFGLPGGIATVCLVLIVLSSFALQAVSTLEIILILLGALLLAVELFVIPGFGIIGITGAIFLMAGLLGLMLPNIGTVTFDINEGTWNAAGEVFMERLAWLSGTFVLTLILMGIWGHYFMPRLTIFNRLVLKGDEEDASEGYVAGPTQTSLPSPGTEGIVIATLRPSGKVEIDKQLYDAMSSGAFIEKGESVKVLRVDGGKLIVSQESST